MTAIRPINSSFIMPLEETGLVDSDRRQQMLETNVRQKDFYESRHEADDTDREESAANRATRLWTKLRRRIMRLRKATGGSEELLSLHRAWLGDLRGARVLDLGCFSGNELSLWIAENASEYIGIDLSQQAIATLNHKLALMKSANARAVRMDFLANDWPDGYFDVVYAYSVLHHFAEIEIALAELRRIVKPGGVVVTMDPLATEPFNRLARAIYRPVQSDRDWEFPFDRSTFIAIRRYFVIERLQGLQGVVKLAYPLLLFGPTERLGQRLAKRLLAFDTAEARSFRMPFFLCWWVAMKLRLPAGSLTERSATHESPRKQKYPAGDSQEPLSH